MLLAKLVRRLIAIRGTTLRADLVERVRVSTLNALACAYEGAEARDSRAVMSVFPGIAGAGRSTIWLAGCRGAPLAVAFANAASIHGSAKQDIHEITDSHPGTVVVPAALSVAEHVGASGAVYASAVVAGCEALGQIGRLASTPTFGARGWRPAAVFGVFGSAAAGAAVLGLDADKTVNALALAGNVAGGVRAYKSSGTGEGGLANASAAQNGIEAAFLAGGGAQAAANLLEAPLGFLNAFSGGREDLGDWPRDSILEIENVYLKPYESCAYNQESIEATRWLVRKHEFRPADVRRVVARSYHKSKHHPGCDNPGPFSGVFACRGSGQFAIAGVLLDKELTEARYQRFADPQITELTSRITLEVDPEAERLFPQARVSTVIVELADGRRFEERVDHLAYPGFPEVATRFRSVASPFLGAENAVKVIDAVAHLERLDAVTEMTELLRR